MDVVNGVIQFYHLISGNVDFQEHFTAIQQAPKTKLLSEYKFDIYIDHSSFEIFVNNGETVLTSIFFPNMPDSTISIEADSTLM
ncbi:GH32 C-terminal domain-containing protein [Colwellia sp. MB02u-18]|uniref:GH32 C-terminal domain-containing protein n=1 Tax=unclassified Colwellia TaxID=196834 RepID=UPI0015F4A444|nr:MULTISPECIES: GH32 C-terminal domain-containing protein [unclassified Colwellia]MBA6224199.1 GH32 C-terminal domain-containing protein [Colwellia sp. MB3u-45]MBA6268329.1 GH32 C-terminal domain-containing protein [Colwellia sp. MB3u-43]MBA6322719.1 GH32 C-terminal domain-containing protein [Colwellia sp. MB02u-19]MBA6323531.1 GH32 C-terminal domain-containing protein [Colwellia sp. MB02u-18]MBA6332862.1 GH32 C-terminal domain-containing protein [Colwellia sp. MB02u-12]